MSTYKVVLLGEGRVGKTSIATRFINKSFNTNEISTITANMYTKHKIKTETGNIINISLWDTAGQERYHALAPIYYRNSHAAVLVYDITDNDTFDRIKLWIRELKQTLGDFNGSNSSSNNNTDNINK
eukprot:Tbor_TRINITY_DN5378_c5_g2::TRINITY_DN5378_c5_g2_i1::g.3992::m.3992/K07890/RAB21; Ras-related protein Rab-21